MMAPTWMAKEAVIMNSRAILRSGLSLYLCVAGLGLLHCNVGLQGDGSAQQQRVERR